MNNELKEEAINALMNMPHPDMVDVVFYFADTNPKDLYDISVGNKRKSCALRNKRRVQLVLVEPANNDELNEITQACGMANDLCEDIIRENTHDMHHPNFFKALQASYDSRTLR